MMNWISSNYLTIINILIVLGVLIYVIVLAVNGKWDRLRADAYKLMLRAETAYKGNKRGQEKFKAVFELIWDMVPAWIKLFVSKDTAKEKLQEWYDQIADYMDDGKLDKSTNGVDLFLSK